MLTQTLCKPRTRPRADEDGQILIMMILCLTVVFVIGVIAVDIGLFLSQRRHAQAAADFAALAAATMLDDSEAATITKGLEYSERNGFDDADGDVTVTVTPTYNGDPDLVEVTISEDAPAMFAPIFGVLGIDIGARAVARVQGAPPSTGLPALFAISDDCGDPAVLEIPGSNNVVVGAVHSNGDLKLNGSNNDFEGGGFTYNCDFDHSGSDNTFDPAPDQTRVDPPPVFYEYDDFPCTHEFDDDIDLQDYDYLWVNDDPDGGVLRDDQVICSSSDLQLSGQGISGRVTLVAGDELKVSGSDFNLTGYWNGVLFYSSASHDSAIDISGSGGDWTGIIHAPHGKVKFQGSSNLSVTGSIIADSMVLSGSDWSISADSSSSSPPQPPLIYLVE
ncbi:MAG TPA: pilus assembly protein TadG-related protein [Dehalococcoidia bacterium]|nr:pilus assembly protein TadG-related protein [Dehalococcoidia bacterium]